jgi:hypothetical protein
MKVKVFTVATMDDELQQRWLQHLRDFDVANPGCHFEVMIDGPEIPLKEMVERITVSPGLTFQKIWERGGTPPWQKK